MQPPLGLAADHHQRAVAIGVDSPAATLLHTAMATATSAVIAAITGSAANAAALPTAAVPAVSTSQDDDQGECELLGPFALFVQLALGGLALLSLVYKRWKERPQRPMKIWFFDVSKQVFGSVLVHIANVFMAMLTSGSFSIKLGPAAVAAAAAQRLMPRDSSTGASTSGYEPNPCSLYLLNLGIDTTLGIPILIVLLRVTTSVMSLTPFGKPSESIQSGNYGDPPSAWWWLKQSVIYFWCLFGMKICVLLIFIMMPWISTVGDWALSWTDGNEKLQIAFVMMIFPLIMNGLQYYIIDSFIKKKEIAHERLPSEDPDEARERYDDIGRRRNSEDSDSDVEHETVRPLKGLRTNLDGLYDPEIDGVAPTIIGSSSSSRVTARGNAIKPELFPKE